YVMNADGTGQTRLTNNSITDEAPFFSSDGTKIAFERQVVGLFQIFLMNADGTNVIQLTSASSNFSPAFSPDGTKITFFSDRDGNDEIYVMESNGANQTRLTNNILSDESPKWQ